MTKAEGYLGSSPEHNQNSGSILILGTRKCLKYAFHIGLSAEISLLSVNNFISDKLHIKEVCIWVFVCEGGL